MLDSGTAVRQEDSRTPIEHALDGDLFARPRSAGTVDLGGPEHGDGLTAVEQDLLGRDLVRAVALPRVVVTSLGAIVGCVSLIGPSNRGATSEFE